MPRIWACGCAYRDTSSELMPDEWSAHTEQGARALLELSPKGMTWAEICVALNASTYRKRDSLHLILHRIAVPHTTPETGRGRKGTRWIAG